MRMHMSVYVHACSDLVCMCVYACVYTFVCACVCVHVCVCMCVCMCSDPVPDEHGPDLVGGAEVLHSPVL